MSRLTFCVVQISVFRAQKSLIRSDQAVEIAGGWTQIRTGDTRIFSAVLYLLSYPAIAVCGDSDLTVVPRFVGDRGLEPLTSTV